MLSQRNGLLFPLSDFGARTATDTSSTFVDNMRLPVHRWFRYTAGFSAEWVESVIRDAGMATPVRVLDPFVGSGTTLIAADRIGVESWGLEAHPFVYRIARAKMAWRSDPEAYMSKIREMRATAATLAPSTDSYPPLIHKCYDEDSLRRLDTLRRAYDQVRDDSPASELAWLTLVAILRKVSHVGTAQWQYVLPKKEKHTTLDVSAAFEQCSRMIHHDMLGAPLKHGPQPQLLQSDARTCTGVPRSHINLVITSPPYPNNYDYADATRLEMSFFQEIDGWGDLQSAVRRHLVTSCSQHVPPNSTDLDAVLASPDLEPIRDELAGVCSDLARVRLTKGGKKTYHFMIACYFRDMAASWRSIREICASPSRVCFVIGDSAPYGVYVPVIPWLGRLAQHAGFPSFSFEKTRDRNIKWKNRKHRVPLQEGRLWVEG